MRPEAQTTSTRLNPRVPSHCAHGAVTSFPFPASHPRGGAGVSPLTRREARHAVRGEECCCRAVAAVVEVRETLVRFRTIQRRTQEPEPLLQTRDLGLI